MWFVRKSLIFVHRYLGIVLSLLFVVWFLSGIAMIYARGMPRLTPQARLERLAPLDLAAVRLTLADAAAVVEADRPQGPVTLFTAMDRPAYRINGETVFADDGEILQGVGAEEALAIASRFTGIDRSLLQHAMQEEHDQWTIGQVREFPIHKITSTDSSRTHLYVSPWSGDPVLMTTRGTRALAWVAAIPHWFYFKDLRMNGPLWRQTVIWSAVLGCVLALAGIALGVLQFKFARPFKLSAAIPYTGWMRWHYITGLIFGVFTLTWVFSGLLSMEPYYWTSTRQILSPGPLLQTFGDTSPQPERFPAFDADQWRELLQDRVLKEIEFTQIQGDPFFIARTANADGSVTARYEGEHQSYSGAADRNRILISVDPFGVWEYTMDPEYLLAQIRESYPDVEIAEAALLSEYDSYYYSRDRQAPLPVLRVKFNDPEQTWFYIDTQMSQVLGAPHRLARLQRWIYNGFHSLDFAFWYYNAPLWQFGVIALSLGGAATSSIGLYLGFRRVVRGVKRLATRKAKAGKEPVKVATD